MCGICGIYNFDRTPVNHEKLKGMNNAMIHRGPDDEGYYISENMGLAMRRLSIIDIEKGHQPIFNENGSLAVVMNGEIYNYRELREILTRQGHIFRTNSDTEVIVHLFEEKGVECVTELNGMFAFAIWDDAKKELFLFRDRLGIKPLFYARSPASFVFCSDLLGITTNGFLKREVDFNAFLSYLGLAYISYPQTIFKNIYKLEPGNFLKISATGDIAKEQYWKIKEFETLILPDIEDYHRHILNLLRDSIRLQMRSDVSIGTFLSGGVDSSSVVALLSECLDEPVKTFSVGFKGGSNELPYARLIAEKFHTEHFEVMMDDSDVPALISEIIEKLDEPISDNAVVPTLLLSKKAIEKGVKVILNGTGGDEIFGGYERYLPRGINKRLVNVLPLSIRKFSGNLFGYFDSDKGAKIASPELEFMASISGVNFSFLKQLIRERSDYEAIINNLVSTYRAHILTYNMKAKTNQMMYFDLKNYLVGDVLSLLDKITMAVSLEGRVPLLDHRIVEFCFQIPDRIKFKQGRLKGLFRDVMKSVLPQEILHLPKGGFAGPTHAWITGSLKRSMREHLIEKPISFYREHLNISVIQEVLDNCERDHRYSETLFSLFIFCLWYKRHIEGEKIVL